MKAAAWFRPASGILISDRQSSGRSKQRCSAYLSQLRSISPVQEPPHSSSLPLPKSNMSLINMKLKPLIAQVEGKTFLPPSHLSYLSLPPRSFPQGIWCCTLSGAEWQQGFIQGNGQKRQQNEKRFPTPCLDFDPSAVVGCASSTEVFLGKWHG